MTLPTTPQGLATTVSGNTVGLAWTGNPQSDQVFEYLVYRIPNSWFAPELVAAVTGTTYTDSAEELLPNTQWYYFLIARNAAGISSPSPSALAMIPQPLPLPSAPTGLAAAANSNDTVSLSWNANPTAQQVTGYNVYREASGSSSATLLATVSGTAYTDTSSALTAKSSWTYYLTAVNATGVSPASATASVTIPQNGALIATFEVNNYGGSSVTNPQVSFAHPFAPGDMPSGNFIQVRANDGTTVIPAQQDQESTWLQDGSWKTAAVSFVSPDTFAAGQTTTYQLWSMPGAPNRNAGVTLAQLTANSDIKLLFTGYDLGSDVYEVSVNDIVANGTNFPWAQTVLTTTGTTTNGSASLAITGSTAGVAAGQVISGPGIIAGTRVQSISGATVTMTTAASASPPAVTVPGTGTITFTTAPTRGWEVIRSGPVCTEWRLWSCLRRVSDGAFHKWLRGVIFVRAWGAAGPYEITGYWTQSNIYGPNPGTGSGITTSNANDFIFTTYRGAQTETAGAGWTQISGSDYLLTEYQVVSTTQTNLVPIGGSGVEQGIGDAIVGGAPDASKNWKAHQTNNGASVNSMAFTQGISTSGTNRVIVVCLLSNTAPGLNITSSSGLSFQRRAQELSISGGTNIYLETWWAAAPNQLSNEIITIHTNGTSTYITADAFAIAGTTTSSPFGRSASHTLAGLNTSSPFDGNASLPANLVPIETKNVFTATLQDGNTILQSYGGPNDYRTAAVTQSSSTINTANGQIALTPAQYNNLLGVGALALNNNGSGNGNYGGGVAVVLSSSGTMPGGLAAGTPYWITGTSGQNAITLSSTLENALNGPSAVPITSIGSGTLTITPLAGCRAFTAMPVLDQNCQRIWRNGSATGSGRPTVLVAHDFTYLTTKSRCLPPYLATVTVDASQSPSLPTTFSQGSWYFPWALGTTGDSATDDRIGYLMHHGACQLYRPFDIALHQLNLAIAAAWINYGYWLLDENFVVYPVVNLTAYPNYAVPVGPNSQFSLSSPGAISIVNSLSTAPVDVAGGDIGGSHQPCPWIMPYLKSGDFLWYEPMAMMFSTRMLASINQTVTVGAVTAYKPWSYVSVSGAQLGDDGIQLRGMGWMMRHFGTTLHFMPDSRPERPYFRDQFHGLVAIANALPATYPAGAQNLGIYDHTNTDGKSGGYYWMSQYMAYMMFFCWAMEAWKGEYPEVGTFITAYLYRSTIAPGNQSSTAPAGDGGQGCILAMNSYQITVADPQGNFFSDWNDAFANSIAQTPIGSDYLSIGSVTQGSATINIATGIATAYNLSTNPGWFVQTLNFNDFPQGTVIASLNPDGGGPPATLTTKASPGTGGNAQSAATRAVTTLTTAAATPVGGNTLTFAAVPAGVTVGMAVVDKTNFNAIPLANGYLTSFVTAVSATTVTLSRPVGAQTNTPVGAGDAIMIGPAVSFFSYPTPWPGIPAVISAYPDEICINGGAEYNNPASYICMAAAGCALGTILGIPNAAAVYNEIRRRQYLGTLNGPLSFNNSPKWAVGPIGATR
ncbi:MAG TPA: fibronectin type III domain-containing protein [Stellaceae bacterium]|nr:fibronectin type III domain-containing protein [Stellaceae bacterium]